MRIFHVTLIVIYLSWFWWYGGDGEPVTAQELTSYIVAVQSNAQARGADATEVVQAMRTLAASDNGDEYIMVNLMRYRDKALYPADSPWVNDPDPMAANERYSAGVIPQLLKRGSLPILVAPVTGAFLNEGNWQEWDTVAMVRYRSVRDMLDMIVEMSGTGLAVHKWASIEETHVFPAQALISLFAVRLLVAAALLVLALLVGGALKIFRRGPGSDKD